MAQEYIEIKGARENNLKNVSLKIPKRKITIFTGVSGSGKSSLVLDTVAMEAQRLLAENFSTFLPGFMPKYPQPAADSLANLNMAVVIDQKRLGGGSHSTVGTVTDISPILRLLFSRAGKPSIGGAYLFFFNDPKGMCPECNGLGRKMGVTMDLFLDESKSLGEGVRHRPSFAGYQSHRRRRKHDDRHRAQPRRHPQRRLDCRHGTGGWLQRGDGLVPRNALGSFDGSKFPHRYLS